MNVMIHQQAEREMPSHFTREYKSLFGVPPIRDVHRLRQAAQVSAGR